MSISFNIDNNRMNATVYTGEEALARPIIDVDGNMAPFVSLEWKEWNHHQGDNRQVQVYLERGDIESLIKTLQHSLTELPQAPQEDASDPNGDGHGVY